MNMISTGAFQTEMDASNKQPTLATKFAAVWEKKNAKAARAGGVSLMALSLAACGSDDSTTTTGDTTTTTVSGVTPIQSDLTNGSDSFVGSSGADKIVAGQVYTPGGNDRINSLQDEDVLDGGAGDDTIDITFGNPGDNGDTIITPTMKNIENVNIAFSDSNGASEIDFQDVTSVVDLAITRISNTTSVTVDNVQDILATLSIVNSGEDNGNVDIHFDDDVLKGAADELALTVSKLDVDDLDISGEDGEGYETIKATASGDAKIDDLQVDSTQTLDFDGAGDVTIAEFTLSAGHLNKFDASDASGDYDVDLGANNLVEATITGTSGADVDFSYLGSTAADHIRVDEASLSAAPKTGDDDNGHDSIDGGTGANTLDFTVKTDAAIDLVHAKTTVTNIQTVRIDNTAANNNAVTLEADLIGGLQTVILHNDAEADIVSDLDVFDMAAGTVVRLEHSDDAGAATNTNSETAGDNQFFVHLKDASGTVALKTADEITVHIDSSVNDSEEFNFTLDLEGDDGDDTDRVDGHIESLSLVDNDNEDNTFVLTSFAEHNGTLTLTGGRADDKLINADDVVFTKIDGTGQLSDVSLDLGTADMDIDMGSGDDNLYFQTIGGLTDDDDVVGGLGTDVVWAGYEANSDNDLNLSGVEQINVDGDTTANVRIDISESDDVVTVGIVSNAHAHNVTAGDEGDVINLIADGIATIELISDAAVGDADGNADDYNGLTITDEDANNPAAVTINVGNPDDDAVNVGVITLDNDTTSLTVNVKLGKTTDANADAAQTTFNEISAAKITSFTVTDEYDLSDAAAIETVIDLDDTTALTTVDASKAQGGVDLTLDGLADSATINLVQKDDNGNDEEDALTITYVGDTGADKVTITGGADVETITITNGDMDDLIINVGDGANVVNLTGMTGDNVEITGGKNVDTITGGNDGDEIFAGEGADIINGGAGADVITLTETTSALDKVTFSSYATSDTVIGFEVGAGKDQLIFDFSELEGGTKDFIRIGKADTSVANAAEAPTLGTITGATDLDTVADAANILVVNIATAIGSTADLETALELGGGAAITLDQAAAVGDTFLVAYDNNVNSYIAQVTVGGDAAGDGATFAVGELSATLLVTLDGIAGANTLDVANFDFVA